MAGRPKRRGATDAQRAAWDANDRLPTVDEQRRFLERIARGMDAKAAITELNLPYWGMYKLRRQDPAFELRWMEALDTHNIERTEPFLDALREGTTVAEACRRSGISRAWIQGRRRRDPVFASDYEQAWQDGADTLEAEAMRRGIQGVEEPIMYRGKQVGAVVKYSDQLLLALLKARRPEQYATTRAKVEVDGGLTPTELEAIRRLGQNPEYADALDKIAEGFSERDSEE